MKSSILLLTTLLCFNLSSVFDFPLKMHKPLTDQDVEDLCRPFFIPAGQQKQLRVKDEEHMDVPANIIGLYHNTHKVLKDFSDAYKAFFLNPRSMLNAKDPNKDFFWSFYLAISHFYVTTCKTSDTMGNLYMNKKNVPGHFLRGFLKQFYEQEYEKSFLQLQKMSLSYLSYLAQHGTEITYPYGDLTDTYTGRDPDNGQIVKKTVHLFYIWDSNGPVVSSLVEPTAVIKLTYGAMIEGVVRSLPVNNYKLVSADGLFFERSSRTGQEIIKVIPAKGYYGAQAFQTLPSDFKKSAVFTGLSTTDPKDTNSFIGYVEQAGPNREDRISFHIGLNQHDSPNEFAYAAEMMGKSKEKWLELPSQEDLNLLYLDYLEEILRDPEHNKTDYDQLIQCVQALPALSWQEESTKTETTQALDQLDHSKPEAALSAQEQLDALQRSLRAEIARQITSSASPEEDQRTKAIQEEQRRARAQKQKTKKGKSTQHHARSQKGARGATAGAASAAASAASAEAAVDVSSILEDVKEKGRVRFRNVREMLNHTRQRLGHHGEHFMNWVRHNLSRRGSHLTVEGSTLVRWHGKDESVPADFANSFVEQLLNSYQQSQR